MSKRNLILLIVILALLLLAFFAILYSKQYRAPGEEGEGTNFISQFNPFGNSGTRNPGDDTDNPVDVSGYEPPSDSDTMRFVRVSSMPIAGYGLFLKERFKNVEELAPEPGEEGLEKPLPTPSAPQTELMPAVRYVDRATGEIYQTFADRIEERKFSSTTIPKVYEASIGNRGESVIMRYLKADFKTIQTFWGILPKDILGGDSAGMETRGTFLPDDIKDFSLSPDSISIFYLFNLGEVSIGNVLNLATGVKVQIFDSPFQEWLSQWPNSKLITLTTKPSSLVPGHMYKLDPGTKIFTRVLSGINGLTTLTSPDGKLILYGDNSLGLYLYRTDTGASEKVGLNTLPEKCVWSSSSVAIYCSVPKIATSLSYPDVWYQGIVSFEDQLWKADLETGTTSLVADLPLLNGGVEVDGIKLSLDSKENYLFLINKKDSYLWALDLR